MARIILFTGKGGVGKTSIAAAHALKSAEEGQKSILVSADMAHNIGDIFQKRVGGEPAELAENLWGLELDPDRMLREEFPEAAKAIRKLLLGSSAGAADLDDFPIPGFEDLFSLLKIAKLHESGEYDRIFVDCAPTGETLSLLKLPELLAWYMEKFFPVGKTMVRILAPVSKVKYHVELPDSKAMDEIGEMHEKLLALQSLLKDQNTSSVRLVCTPEKMVVEETKRSYMYLSLYGYQTDGVFINRVIPAGTGNAFLESWRDIQQGYVEELRRVFTGIPVAEIPWYPGEVRGREAVGRISCDVLADPALFDVRVHTEQEMYSAIPGGYRLTIPLPGAERGEVKVSRHDLDLDIAAGNFLRRIPRPDVLRGTSDPEVVLEDGELKVSFRTDRKPEEREESEDRGDKA